LGFFLYEQIKGFEIKLKIIQPEIYIRKSITSQNNRESVALPSFLISP